MLENLLDLVFVGGMVAAFYFYIHLPRKKRKQRHSKNEIELEENTKMKDLDFYGVNKMDEDREKFMQEVRNKKTKMENGEEISVDAAQAFALIRNSKYNDLIVSENGKINMKKILSDEELEIMKNKIQNFKVDPSVKKVEFKVPGYVQKVEDIKDGGVRWVFTKEHAEWCGIESVCYDKFDRATPDPDKVAEDEKSKSKKVNEDKNDFLLDSVNELKKEQRKTNQHLAENKMKESLKNFENLNLDDAQILEQEITIPNFEQLLEQEVKNVEEKRYFEDISYFSPEMIKIFADKNPLFFKSVLEKLFSKNATNFLFLDFEKRNIYIEKNYFAKTVKTFFDYNGKIKFDQDFVKEDCADIYDGNKINDLIRDVSTEKTCEAFGSRNGMKFLYNLLLESQDVADLCISGWFLKFKFENIENINLVLDTHQRGADVIVVADSLKEIKTRSKKVKNLKVFY